MKNSQIKIRRFEEGDETQIKDLIKQIMSEEFQEDQKAYPTNDIENITEAYGNLGDSFFVAQDGNRIVGTVAIKKEDERLALLRRLFVASSHRKRRIGFNLIERALQFCHEVGYDEIIFRTTSRMSSAIQLCEKRGFVQRARLDLGPIELLKFSFSIRDGIQASQ